MTAKVAKVAKIANVFAYPPPGMCGGELGANIAPD
jgi:hypothetical protein